MFSDIRLSATQWIQFSHSIWSMPTNIPVHLQLSQCLITVSSSCSTRNCIRLWLHSYCSVPSFAAHVQLLGVFKFLVCSFSPFSLVSSSLVHLNTRLTLSTCEDSAITSKTSAHSSSVRIFSACQLKRQCGNNWSFVFAPRVIDWDYRLRISQ